MNAGQTYSMSDPGEADVYGFDLSNDMVTGDSIIGMVWYCTVADSSPGADPSPSTRLSGLPWAYSATATAQKVVGGVSGVIYILRAVVTTAQGYSLSLWAYAPCGAVA
jgi:hypothetical protein